jgi:hypothetical protein
MVVRALFDKKQFLIYFFAEAAPEILTCQAAVLFILKLFPLF